MGIFDRFENAVERGVNGAFSRVFRSGMNSFSKPPTTHSLRATHFSARSLSTSQKIATNSPASSRFRHATNAAQRPRRRPRRLHPSTPSLTSTERSGSSPNPSPSLAAGPRPTLPSLIREFPADTWNFVSPQPALLLPIWARQMVPSSKDTASTRRPFLTETRSPSAAPVSYSGRTRKVRMPSDF